VTTPDDPFATVAPDDEPLLDGGLEGDLDDESGFAVDDVDAESVPAGRQRAARSPVDAGGDDLLEREGEAAADYLEGLLDIIDADGDIDMDVDGDRAAVSIIGDRLRHLVGPKGVVLDALQELTRLAVTRETGVRSRLMLDIGGFRAARRTELTALGSRAAERAAETGQPVHLDPMSAFERKVVHDAVAAAGLRSESDGVEPQRHVVVFPTTSRGDDEVADLAAADADAAGDATEPVA
jgi:spoIIIJ-associated protein